MNETISIEDKVRKCIDRHFSGYKFSIMEDPEDETVKFIRLYDVADADVKSFRSRLWDAIETDLEIQGMSFVPSIVSHSNTEKFYSDCQRSSSPVYIYEDLSLQDETLRMLEGELKKLNYPIEEKCDFPGATFPCLEKKKIEIPLAVRLENGGCGYAGRKYEYAA